MTLPEKWMNVPGGSSFRHFNPAYVKAIEKFAKRAAEAIIRFDYSEEAQDRITSMRDAAQEFQKQAKE